jgi:hypothetical protein
MWRDLVKGEIRPLQVSVEESVEENPYNTRNYILRIPAGK